MIAALLVLLGTVTDENGILERANSINFVSLELMFIILGVQNSRIQ